MILKIFISIWWKKKYKYTKQKNRTYYFYNDIIDLENFEKIYLQYWIYYNLKIDNCKNIYSVNPLYFCITHTNGYIEHSSAEQINENKYLIFDSIDENKELLKKYHDVFNEIRDKIKEINSDECDYMKVKFNSVDNLPLNKPLNFHNMTITIRSVFKEDGKLYPQVFLDDTLYELNI